MSGAPDVLRIPSPPVPERTWNDLARDMWRGRAEVLGWGAAGLAVAVVLSFVLPPSYEAVTTAIPVAPSPRVAGLEAAGLRAEELGMLATLGPQRTSTYPDIARSRRLLSELLATRLPTGQGAEQILLIDLVQPNGQGARRQEAALHKLRQQVDAVVDRRSGLLTLRVRSRRAVVAAGAANALRDRMQDFAVHSMAGHARENREFIEGRLRDTRTELGRAEEVLRIFRENNLRIGNSPRLLLDQGRLMREVRTHEEIFLALTREYELAKVAERRDVPVITVLDVATPPANRVSPRRGSMAAVGLLMGGLLGALLATTRRHPNASRRET